jgi:hypothetical protein
MDKFDKLELRIKRLEKKYKNLDKAIQKRLKALFETIKITNSSSDFECNSDYSEDIVFPKINEIEEKINELNRKINEIYYTPGMPGMIKAEASFGNLQHSRIECCYN